MTVGMALVDFIPVVLFLAAIILLQRDLYECFSKGAFALFAGGGIMVFCAGLFKATWKLLYALNICDFQKLNQVFFPMQATGFHALGGARCQCSRTGIAPCRNRDAPSRGAGRLSIEKEIKMKEINLILGLSLFFCSGTMV